MIQILTTPPIRKMVFSSLKENWSLFKYTSYKPNLQNQLSFWFMWFQNNNFLLTTTRISVCKAYCIEI
jgi:hypothetical protein